MRPFGQAAIWGFVNAAFYGLSAATSYPNAVAPDPLNRWAFGGVAFASVLVVSTLAGWWVIRTRRTAPARAWWVGGLAACVAAGLAYVPVLYWVTDTAYDWYAGGRASPDAIRMTFLGGVLALSVEIAVVFVVVLGVSRGMLWMKRR